MSVKLVCDVCKKEFRLESEHVNLFRFYTVNKREAIMMETCSNYAYDTDFHLCDDCFSRIEDYVMMGSE